MDTTEEKKTSKHVKIVFIVFISALVFLQLWKFHWSSLDIELKNQSLHVLHAKTIYQQYRGLGKRESLGRYDGMVFVFDVYAKHGIVMRDMMFPIDIVWLRDAKVVDIAPRVQLEPGTPEQYLRRYYPRVEADIVLELPAGWAEEHDLKLGDEMKALDS